VSPDAEVEAVRSGVGLFTLGDRMLVELRGGDRVRWIQGQVSNDVASLAPGQGCYATVLTVKGGIVADLHVLAWDGCFWLETGASAREALWQRLDRTIVADDVTLLDASARFARLALEGARVNELLSEVSGLPGRPASAGTWPLAPECAERVEIAGRSVVTWAFGFTNGPAVQLLTAPEDAAAVRAALVEVGARHGLVSAGRETLDTLRVEAGVPGLGSELDEDVFPAEARLEHALSTNKGCYTGQEIVERIRSRGAVNYRLVGLRFAGPVPAPGAELRSPEGKRVGEVTSVARSPRAGAIGLGFLRRELETPGTEVQTPDATARVAELPFV